MSIVNDKESGTDQVSEPPVPLGYVAKRLLLGKPLITERLKDERLSNPVALGVLSPDAISSSAYGTEEILLELLPYAGLAAFALVLPITGVILVILLLVAASYRQVVSVYTRAGGSYVVARENFGPKVAQIAAAALLIDYVVTVAVQTSAGTVAVVSAIPVLGPYSLEITVAIVIILCYVNLRGLREAGRPFALPTYFFAAMVIAVIVVGVIRSLTTGLPQYDAAHIPGAVSVHHSGGLIMGATILVVLRAFANGGSSLTGVEAISNTVSAFRNPRGANARKVLTTMAITLGFLVAGVSYLTYITHATPYTAGYPSVLSQEARAVFGSGIVGTVLFALVQTASALILYTGANTSFNGFPFLASFVAQDRFLPRQLTKRGHRLVFSNGIIVLAALSVILLIVTGGTVNSLVPFYAIGVFTGFAMAGYGMTKHHLQHREGKWRFKLAINLSAGILATIVVGIFAVAKFTEGAWLVVVVFPLLVFILIRLNREYRAEAAILERIRATDRKQVGWTRHQVYVLVSGVDLAVLSALRYGRSLRPDNITAVHFMVDAAQADVIRHRWDKMDMPTPLRIIDCPDRRIARAAQELAIHAAGTDGKTGVTILLPRRTYAPLLGRLLHDRTADHIAKVISQVPQAAATIIPYDVQSRLRKTFPDLPEERITRWFERKRNKLAGSTPPEIAGHNHPTPDQTATPIASARPGERVIIEGRLREITDVPEGKSSALSGIVSDASGSLTVHFDTDSTDLEAGQLISLSGIITRSADEEPVMIHPHCDILESEQPEDN